MTATMTHDTKRSEDVRARLAVLSEMPDEWRDGVERLRSLAPEAAARVAPADTYLFYQTVVAMLPIGMSGEVPSPLVDRIVASALKAAREAKVQTSWTSPNQRYDEDVERMVRESLRSGPFLAAAYEIAGKVAPYGAQNSLSQLALRLASPGVPDIYQGCERRWELSLVDPDNRRPVDFARRRAQLADLAARGEPGASLCRELVEGYADGRIKMHVMRTGLRLRRQLPRSSSRAATTRSPAHRTSRRSRGRSATSGSSASCPG